MGKLCFQLPTLLHESNGSPRSVDTWINNRGYDKGSLKPDWRDAGRTHGGMSTPGARDFIKFGRVGTSGRADYMWLRVHDDGESHYTYIDWWRNTGSGGTQLKGVS